MKIIKSVECESCGELYKLDDNTYISVHGNICAGESGGIVGNNFDDDGLVKHVSIFCFQ